MAKERRTTTWRAACGEGFETWDELHEHKRACAGCRRENQRIDAIETDRQARDRPRRTLRNWLQSDLKRVGDQFRLMFSGRSSGWWTGAVVGLVLTVLISAGFNIDIRNMALPIVLLAGFVGDAIVSHALRVKDGLVQDRNVGARLRRRFMLGAGVLLFVVNIFPAYQADYVHGGGGYYWSSTGSLLAGIGALLVVFAIFTKPKGEPL